MTREDIANEYFDWLYALVNDSKYTKRATYRRLLMCLHTIDFTYTIPLDENRAQDGVDLRYRFAMERGYMLTDVPIGQCSVLEMLVALAYRCEEHIMVDPDIGNRTGQWFWTMISNIGLDSMIDGHFDKRYVLDKISKLLNRDYQKNGSGGLFTIDNCSRDLRRVEIWYQMCWYLDSIL